MIVKFRPMQPGDKELFKSFIRSLPRKDNYYLLFDVDNDQAIDRWMEKIQSGETIGVVATEGGNMIGYCNLKTNDLPWTRHVGEIRISVSAAYRGRGNRQGSGGAYFLNCAGAGAAKALGANGDEPGCGPTYVQEPRIPHRGSALRLRQE